MLYFSARLTRGNERMRLRRAPRGSRFGKGVEEVNNEL